MTSQPLPKNPLERLAFKFSLCSAVELSKQNFEELVKFLNSSFVPRVLLESVTQKLVESHNELAQALTEVAEELGVEPEHDKVIEAIKKLKQKAAPEHPWQEKACGGCGATEEKDRCIGCHHQF